MRIDAKCSVAVHCLLFLSEYGERQKVTSQLLACSTGCNPAVIRGILSALKKEGLVTVRAGVGGTKLARPPEEITLCQVCMALDPKAMEKLMGLHPRPSELCPVGRNIHGVLERTYDQVREDMKKSLTAITLADVCAEYRRALAGEGKA